MASPNVKLRITRHGRPGSSHVHSEDRMEVKPIEGGGVLGILSDGVGASRYPERCAERTIRLMADGFPARPRQWPVEKVFDRLVEQVNQSLFEEGRYRDGTASMQATLSTVFIQHNRLQGCNAGDSPVLFLRGNKEERLSENHSQTNSDGQEILTQAVGMGFGLSLHHFQRELEVGDRVLLLSDGVAKLLDDEAMGLEVRKNGSAHDLINLALERAKSRKTDDLSAILIEVEQLDSKDSEQMVPEPWPSPGKGLDHQGYRLIQRLAKNDRVWLAEKQNGRFVLKFIPKEAETDDSGLVFSRFAHERWTACRLQSPLFVTSRVPESGSMLYYVMEYLEAPSLRFALKSRRLAVDEAVDLGLFLGQAGQHLLTQELVHGDIKPDNLIVFREAGLINFKLLDLGLATPVFTDNGTSGTPSYLAPERFRGAAVTERTEIFAIGATLYEALTGRPPFGLIERFQTPTFKPAFPPSRLNPNVPPWLDAVVMKCLSLNQEKRFQCYSELLFALRHPQTVLPFTEVSAPWLEKNPLLFYKTACALLLFLVILLVLKLLTFTR